MSQDNGAARASTTNATAAALSTTDNANAGGEATAKAAGRASGGGGGYTLTNDVGMLVVHPDCLLSGTRIADSFDCQRKARKRTAGTTHKR